MTFSPRSARTLDHGSTSTAQRGRQWYRIALKLHGTLSSIPTNSKDRRKRKTPSSPGYLLCIMQHIRAFWPDVSRRRPPQALPDYSLHLARQLCTSCARLSGISLRSSSRLPPATDAAGPSVAFTTSALRLKKPCATELVPGLAELKAATKTAFSQPLLNW